MLAETGFLIVSEECILRFGKCLQALAREHRSHKRQVMCEYTTAGTVGGYYICGNYIDEVLCMYGPGLLKFVVHDHLYSPVALLALGATVLERYEYDAYGNCRVLEPNFADDPDGKSDYANPYLFAGRRVDILDGSSSRE